MKGYVKSFFIRGLIFSGFGPVILAIIYLCLEFSLDGFSLTGSEVFWGIISVYLLAFVQAGASVFNQVEHWPVAKSTLIHFSVLYAVYIVCYLVNSWIPFNINIVLIFTGIFVLVYLSVWLTVYMIIRKCSKELNKKLQNNV